MKCSVPILPATAIMGRIAHPEEVADPKKVLAAMRG